MIVDERWRVCGNDGSIPHTTSHLSLDEFYEVQCCYYYCDQMMSLFINDQYMQNLLMKPIALSFVVLNLLLIGLPDLCLIYRVLSIETLLTSTAFCLYTTCL